jgi:hypothetical protein
MLFLFLFGFPNILHKLKIIYSHLAGISVTSLLGIILVITFFISLLVPHRWTLKTPTYQAKLLLLLVGGFYFIYVGVKGIYFDSDNEYKLATFAYMIIISLGIISPLTLYMKKQLSKIKGD